MRSTHFVILIVLALPALAQAITYSSTKSEFKLSHKSYISSGQGYFGGEDTESQISTAGVGIDYLGRSGSGQSRINFDAFYSFAEDYPFISARELYTERKAKDNTITYGRKIQNLSAADEFWETGLWQPRFNWDKISPETNGLTGVFFETQKNRRSKWLAYVTGLNVPEQGARYELVDGMIVSKNPFFKPPPKQANIAGQLTDVTYKIDQPPTSEIIFKPGLGFRVDNQIATKENLAFGYAYKPLNQFLTSYDYRLRIEDNSQQAPITIIPQFPYHHIVTSEWTREDRLSLLSMALTFERPDRLPENDMLVSQQIDNQVLASAIYSYNLAGEGPSAFRVYTGFLKSWGAIANDGGDTFSERTQFEMRQRWYEAYRVGMTYPVWTKFKRLSNTMELTYDRMQNGALFKSQLEYQLYDSWIFSGAFDVVAVFDSRQTKFDSAVLRQFRANDRVTMGLSYVY